VNWLPAHINQMHSGAIYALAHDGHRGILFSGGADCVVAAWNQSLEQQTGMTIRTSAPIYSLCFIEALRTLYIGLNDGSLHAIHVDERNEIAAVKESSSAIYSMVHDAKNDWLWLANGEGLLSIRKASDGSKVRSIPFSAEKIRQLSLSPDNQYLAVAGERVWIIDTDFANTRHTYKGHEGGATAVCWHPGKKAVISGGKDGHIRVWSTETGNELLAFPAHRFAIYRLVIDHVNGAIISSSRDGSIKMWNIESLDHIATIDKSAKAHTHSVNAIVVQVDGIISAGDDRKIIRWEKTELG
jgi:WD repeat-containing protein 61